MAALTFNFVSYAFESGLKMVERGYVAARDAILTEIDLIKAKARTYEQHVADGGEPIGEWEDGHLLWDQSQLFEAEIIDAYEVLYEVRKTFIIALYHFWERAAAGWKGSEGSHAELAEYCRQEGYGPSPELEAVRCLANFLKHGSNSRYDWLDRLRKLSPSILPNLNRPGFAGIIGLSDNEFFKVAEIIRESGPREITSTA